MNRSLFSAHRHATPHLVPLALVCSVKCPGDLILKTYDLAQQLREAEVTIIGGFHSLMERECLTILLRGNQPPNRLSGPQSEEHAVARCIQETARSRTTLAAFTIFAEGTAAYCGADKPKKPTGWSFSDCHFREPCRTCRQDGSTLSSSPSVEEADLHPPVRSQYKSSLNGRCASGCHA